MKLRLFILLNIHLLVLQPCTNAKRSLSKCKELDDQAKWKLLTRNHRNWAEWYSLGMLSGDQYVSI